MLLTPGLGPMARLKSILKQQKQVILHTWIYMILSAYSNDAAKFMKRQKDKFQNPVGLTVSENTEILFDELIEGFDNEKTYSALDNILKIRAVQDFSPSQAVSFIYFLKEIIAEQIGDQLKQENLLLEFRDFDNRIDQLVLLTFYIYTKCRENLFKIRLKEIKKWSSGLSDKINNDHHRK